MVFCVSKYVFFYDFFLYQAYVGIVTLQFAPVNKKGAIVMCVIEAVVSVVRLCMSKHKPFRQYPGGLRLFWVARL